jgi:hypothetical protein
MQARAMPMQARAMLMQARATPMQARATPMQARAMPMQARAMLMQARAMLMQARAMIISNWGIKMLEVLEKNILTEEEALELLWIREHRFSMEEMNSVSVCRLLTLACVASRR